MAGVCGLTWHYDPVYDHPPHPDHDCGQPLGHGGDHECSRCKCWITPEAVAAGLYGVS